MKRKIIELSNRTYVVTVPYSWLLDHHLGKGDEVEMKASGSAILIETLRSRKESRATVDIRGLNSSLAWHAIISRYVRGYREIVVLTDERGICDPRTGKMITQHAAIDRVMDSLIGMSVERRSKNSTTIKETALIRREDQRMILRRLWLCVMAMFTCASAKKIESAEQEINRLSLYSLKTRRIGEISDLTCAIEESILARCLENMGDAIKNNTSRTSKHFGAANEFTQIAYKCWFKPTDNGFDLLYTALTKVRETSPSSRSCLTHACEALTEAVTANWEGSTSASWKGLCADIPNNIKNHPTEQKKISIL